MPIVESRIDKIEPQRLGRIRVHFFFRDHTGHIEDPKLDVPVGFDTARYLIDHATFLDANVIENEKELVEAQVSGGEDPAGITVDHITPRQRLRAILMALMRGQAQQIIRAALWLDANVTDAQLNRAVGGTRRIKIRARITSLLSLRPALDADEAMRDG